MNSSSDGMLSFLLGFEAGDLPERVAELTIVHLDAIVKVDDDLFLRKGEENVALVRLQLREHGGVLVDQLQVPRPRRAGEVGAVVFRDQVFAAGGELGDVLAQIVVEDDADRIGAITVHVDQRVEGALGGREEPVDRALLIPLDMLLVKVFHEILAEIFAQRPFDEPEILREMLLAEGKGQERFELRNNVIHEPLVVEDGDNAVLVGGEVVSDQ